MIVGILTHSLGKNYGGLLQNYALQQVLIRLGHNPITIDHRPEEDSLINKFFSICKRLYLNARGQKTLIRAFTTKNEDGIIMQYVNDFVHCNIIKTSPCSLRRFHTLSEIQSFDAIVVGSDQVWRYRMFHSDIVYMFLSSLQGVPFKRIAYSASFGTDIWEMPKDITDKVRILAEKFDAISVREKSGVDLCKKHLDRDAVQVLDPTMLLDANDYSTIINNSTVNIDSFKSALTTYILDDDVAKGEIVEKIAKDKNLTIYNLMPKSKFSEVGSCFLSDCIFPPVETWLKGIRDSELVITDSFHGTVFCIIFNKPFWVLRNTNRGNTRIDSLLECFGLESRCITEAPKFIDTTIDWDRVNKTRNVMIKESMAFLKQYL